MDKLKFKNKIVHTCTRSLENNSNDIKNTIDEIIETASNYEGDHDIFDPFKEDMMKKKDLQVEQLQKILNDIKIIKKVDAKRVSKQVEFGSVVITNKQKMFIAVALGKIKVENDTFFAISIHVPIYKAMQGLKAGDTFTVNNNKLTIKDIF